MSPSHAMARQSGDLVRTSSNRLKGALPGSNGSPQTQQQHIRAEARNGGNSSFTRRSMPFEPSEESLSCTPGGLSSQFSRRSLPLEASEPNYGMLAEEADLSFGRRSFTAGLQPQQVGGASGGGDANGPSPRALLLGKTTSSMEGPGAVVSAKTSAALSSRRSSLLKPWRSLLDP